MKTNKKYKVIEQSRFLSDNELVNLKGGSSTELCSATSYFFCQAYKQCSTIQSLGLEVCGIFTLEPCMLKTTCDFYDICSPTSLYGPDVCESQYVIAPSIV